MKNISFYVNIFVLAISFFIVGCSVLNPTPGDKLEKSLNSNHTDEAAVIFRNDESFFQNSENRIKYGDAINRLLKQKKSVLSSEMESINESFDQFTNAIGNDLLYVALPESHNDAAIKTSEAEDSKYALTVETDPKDAKVYIMNIKPKYQDGIMLEAGEYDIKVKRKGYAPKRMVVGLDKNLKIKVVLVQTDRKEKQTYRVDLLLMGTKTIEQMDAVKDDVDLYAKYDEEIDEFRKSLIIDRAYLQKHINVMKYEEEAEKAMQTCDEFFSKSKNYGKADRFFSQRGVVSNLFTIYDLKQDEQAVKIHHQIEKCNKDILNYYNDAAFLEFTKHNHHKSNFFGSYPVQLDQKKFFSQNINNSKKFFKNLSLKDYKIIINTYNLNNLYTDSKMRLFLINNFMYLALKGTEKDDYISTLVTQRKEAVDLFDRFGSSFDTDIFVINKPFGPKIEISGTNEYRMNVYKQNKLPRSKDLKNRYAWLVIYDSQKQEIKENGSETVYSEFESGTSEVYNLEHIRAERKYSDAKSWYDYVKTLRPTVQFDPNNPMTGIARQLEIENIKAKKRKAKNRLEEARYVWATTPEHVYKTNYESYQFTRTNIQASDTTNFTIKLYDTKNNRCYEYPHLKTYNLNTEVVDGLSNKDKNWDAYKNTPTRNDLINLFEATVKFDLLDLLPNQSVKSYPCKL